MVHSTRGSAPGRSLPAPEPLPRGLQTRLLLQLLPLILLLPLAGTYSGYLLYQQAMDDTRARGEALIHQLAGSVDITVERHADDLIDQVSKLPEVAYALVYDRQGEIRAHNLEPLIPAALSSLDTTTAQRRPLLLEPAAGEGPPRKVLDLIEPIQGGQLGTVRLGLDLDLAQRKALSRAAPVLVVHTGLALVALLLGLLAARRTARPLRRLAALAEQVERGELPEVGRIEGPGEVVQVARGLDHAVRRLQGATLHRLRTELAGQRQVEAPPPVAAETPPSPPPLSPPVPSPPPVDLQPLVRTLEAAAAGDLGQRLEEPSPALVPAAAALHRLLEELEAALAWSRFAAVRLSAAGQELIAAGDADRDERKEAAVRTGSALTGLRETSHQVRQSAAAALEAMHRTLEAGAEWIARPRRQASAATPPGAAATVEELALEARLLALNAALEATSEPAGQGIDALAEELRRLAEDLAAVGTQLQRTTPAGAPPEADPRDDGRRLVELAQQALYQAQELEEPCRRLASQVPELIAAVGQLNATEPAEDALATAGHRLQQLGAELEQRLSRFQLSDAAPEASAEEAP